MTDYSILCTRTLEICARSRRALLRDALARERSADVVARLRDRVDCDARAGTPREHADDEDVEERADLVEGRHRQPALVEHDRRQDEAQQRIEDGADQRIHLAKERNESRKHVRACAQINRWGVASMAQRRRHNLIYARVRTDHKPRRDLDERVADGRSRGDDLLRLALARRRRDWEEGVCLAHDPCRLRVYKPVVRASEWL